MATITRSVVKCTTNTCQTSWVIFIWCHSHLNTPGMLIFRHAMANHNAVLLCIWYVLGTSLNKPHTWSVRCMCICLWRGFVTLRVCTMLPSKHAQMSREQEAWSGSMKGRQQRQKLYRLKWCLKHQRHLEAVEIPEVRLVIRFLRQKKLDSGMMKGSTPG